MNVFVSTIGFVRCGRSIKVGSSSARGLDCDLSDGNQCAPNLLHALQEGETFGDLSPMKNLSEEDFFLSSGCSSSQRACSGDIAAVVEWLSDMQTFEADAKFSSAVLQNRNSMVNLFRASNWVSESKDAIVSRSVTTLCWYDCSQSYRCPNQSWLLNRWTQEKVSVFTARGADTLIERGL